MVKTELGAVSFPSELLVLKKDLEVVIGYINENVVSVFGEEEAH